VAITRSMRGDQGCPVLMRMPFVKRWRARAQLEIDGVRTIALLGTENEGALRS